MAIATITTAEVKEKANITVATYDTAIGNLISNMQKSIEYGLDPTYTGSTDADLLKLLKLGILEQIAGEAMCLKSRGWVPEDSVSVGGISVSPSGASTPADFKMGQELIACGEARLKPYRRRVDPVLNEESVQSTTADTDRRMTMDTMEEW